MEYFKPGSIRWDIHFGNAGATFPLPASGLDKAVNQSRPFRLREREMGLILLRPGLAGDAELIAPVSMYQGILQSQSRIQGGYRETCPRILHDSCGRPGNVTATLQSAA